jgi:opacity protein-like surface antigen
MMRISTSLAAIIAASLGLWPLGASAQATHEDHTRIRRGAVFSDLYLGAAITTDAKLTVDGVPQEESLLCGAECSSTKSPVGGIRIGWFSQRFPWLGASGDFSVFIQSWGIESPYEVTGIPISALLMLRLPLVKTPDYPNGRAQPYLAIGPSLMLSMAKLAEGSAALGTARIDTDTSVDPALDARVGIRLVASSWISVILEYRATYFTPSWQINGRTVETTVWTNHFNIGLGIHY